MEQKIECVKCGWVGGYGDLIAPTSDHEPSCPECLGDDFTEVDESDQTLKIWEEILRERKRQDEQWGGPDHDDRHFQEDWCEFICDFANADRGPILGFRGRMVRVAALAIAAIQSQDRKSVA